MMARLGSILTAEVEVLDLIEQNRGALEELCRRYHVKRLDIFGSAVTGKFDPARSDLDFLVVFQELEPGKSADAYFGLLEGLQSLFGREVDLVSDRAIRNPYFRANVESERLCLYGEAAEGFIDRRALLDVVENDQGLAPLRAASYLWEARTAAEQASQFLEGTSIDRYRADELLKSGVERQMGIVAGALSQTERRFPDLAAGLPSLPDFVALGDTLLHRYWEVDDREVWDTVQDKLPSLRNALENLLAEAPTTE